MSVVKKSRGPDRHKNCYLGSKIGASEYGVSHPVNHLANQVSCNPADKLTGALPIILVPIAPSPQWLRFAQALLRSRWSRR